MLFDLVQPFLRAAVSLELAEISIHNAFYYSFFCDTLRHWNTLPHDIIDSPDAEHFKSKQAIHFRDIH